MDVLQPTNLALEGAHSTIEFNQDGEDLAKKCEQVLEMTKLLVEKAESATKSKSMLQDMKWSMRCAKKVLLNVNNFTLPEGLTPKPCPKIKAPFPIVEQVFKDTYKLELPLEIKVHLTFHVSLLKSFNENTLWPDHKQVIMPPPDLVRGHFGI